jgi:hypothetical protein
MAKPRSFHVVFLERVIAIPAVQRHRAAVKDEYADHFFTAGRRPTIWGDDLWPLDELPPPPPGDMSEYGGPPAWSLALQVAWAAVYRPWRNLVAALRSGELALTGRHPVSGVRSDIDPAELARAGLVLNVRNGDLVDDQRRPMWTSLLVHEAGYVPAGSQSAARNNPRVEQAEQKRRICQAVAAALIAENPLLESRPTDLAKKVEQRCLRELQQFGHKKMKFSYKTVATYLRK